MTRYQNAVLTVIAVCLVYLCLVLTPWPRVMAQGSSIKPPEQPTTAEPIRVYVVGWYDSEGRPHHLPAVPGATGKSSFPIFQTNP
jgi:hypothetical protein